MGNLSGIYNKNDLSFRNANPEADLDYAYNLFKKLTHDMVVEHRGDWPEEHQREFFRRGFSDPAMKMVEYQGKPVGCFCITEESNHIYLQRMYLEPAMQGKGIGSQIINLALQKAHETRKPLDLGVLQTNSYAKAVYEKLGFTQTGINEWEFEMRHKDTAHYAPQSKPAPQP